MEGRGYNFIRSIWPMVGLLAIQTIMSIMAMEILMPYYIKVMPKDSIDAMMEYFLSTDSINILTSLTYILYCVLALPLYGIFYYRSFVKRDSSRFNNYLIYTSCEKTGFSFKGFSPVKMILGFILLPCGLIMISNFIVSALTVINPQWMEDLVEIEKYAGLGEDMSPAVILYAIVLGPILEEVAFRGITTEYLKRSMGFWGTVIVQGILFGIMHMNVMQGVYAAVIGFAWGYVYLKTGNIFITIILHMLNNLAAMLLPDPELGNSPVIFFVLILLSLIASYGGLVCFKYAKKDDLPEDGV